MRPAVPGSARARYWPGLLSMTRGLVMVTGILEMEVVAVSVNLFLMARSASRPGTAPV